MANRPKLPLTAALSDAERELQTALDHLLRCAVTVGGTIPGTPANRNAVRNARAARQGVRIALAALRQSQRASTRTDTANALLEALAQFEERAAQSDAMRSYEGLMIAVRRDARRLGELL
jgi:hypothetical protein